jgi:HSP20 family protein
MALELWKPRGSLMRSPFRELSRIEREMEDLAGRYFREWPAVGRTTEALGWAPDVDLIDKPDAILVRADLPGLEQKDVDVTIQDGTLTLRGERKEERVEKDEGYYLCERRAGTFARSFSLPPGVEADKIKATFKNGVLEVYVPKSKEAKGKKIEVKVQ